jgi:hypothetical protein
MKRAVLVAAVIGLAAVVIFHRSRPSAPPAAAPDGPAAGRTSSRLVRAPRLLALAEAPSPSPAPEEVRDDEASTSFGLPPGAVAGNLVKPAQSPPPPSPVAARRPPESITAAFTRYRDELCACQTLACAEAVGARHSPLVADADYSPENAPALREMSRTVTKCLSTIMAHERGGG